MSNILPCVIMFKWKILCGWDGMVAGSVSIILIGTKTTVHHNCTDGYRDDYGLTVYNSSSTISQTDMEAATGR